MRHILYIVAAASVAFAGEVAAGLSADKDGESFGLTLGASAQEISFAPRMHCDEDTVEVQSLLRQLAAKGGSVEERRVSAAYMLQGRPVDDAWEKDSLGPAQVNIHSFSPLSFINAVEALAVASGVAQPTWRDYLVEYSKRADRRGEYAGVGSEIYHGAEWIADNVYRGNLKELTENFDGCLSKTKNLDYMSRNRDKFAMLSDPEIFDKIEMIEMGFRVHRVPYLKRHFISRKDVAGELRDGDIILMIVNADGSDIYRIGYVVSKDGERYLLRADTKAGTVTDGGVPLDGYFKDNAKYFYGFRLLRWQ